MVGVEEGREFRFRGDLYSQESTFRLVIYCRITKYELFRWLVETPPRDVRATFSTSGSSYLNVALITVHHLYSVVALWRHHYCLHAAICTNRLFKLLFRVNANVYANELRLYIAEAKRCVYVCTRGDQKLLQLPTLVKKVVKINGSVRTSKY